MDMSRNTTPVPYQPGKSLQLQVLWSCDPPLPSSVTAIITKMFDMTMSSVMNVTINTKSGFTIRAVLKLYDRRFGTDLRKIYGKHAPHTAADEAIFQSFIQQGKVGPFLRELEEEKKAALIVPKASHLHNGTPEGIAKYEAALWQECNEYFDCETKAYARLQDLQGKSIPRMYAHVCLRFHTSDVPLDLLQPEIARYFEVKGVLLELVPGCSLWDLATPPLAPLDPKVWQAIVQSAVNIAHDINKHDVIMNDCGPRNVVVDKHSQAPFIIDLAQCYFKDELIKVWETIREEDEDWDPNVEYWERAMAYDNPGAIGSVMATLLLQTKGITLDIKYPNREY